MDNKQLIDFVKLKYPSHNVLFRQCSEYEEGIESSKVVNLIIVDPQFSVISTLISHLDDIIINCIQLPLNDLDIVLSNERFGRKGTVLKLIAEGEILHSKGEKLAKLIVQRAKYLHKQINYIFRDDYRKNVETLNRLRNGFNNKELKPHQKFFLVNELVTVISEVELLRNSNWMVGGHNKSSFLFKNSYEFLNQIMSLTANVYRDYSSESFLKLQNYVKFYLEKIGPVRAKNGHRSFMRYGIEIRYVDFDLTEFVLKVLTQMKAEPLLAKHLEYFYLSPKNQFNIYQGHLTLILRFSNELTRNQAYLLITKVIEVVLKKEIRLSFLPEDFLNHTQVNKDLFTLFSPIATEISKLIENQIRKKKQFDEEKMFFISIILGTYALKLLNLSLSDIIKINFYISIKTMFNSAEQKKFQSMDLLNDARQQKYQLFKSYYTKNAESIDALVKQGLTYKTTKSKEYNLILQELAIYIKSLDDNVSPIVEQNEMCLLVLKENFNVEEEIPGAVYAQIFEQMLMLMNLENHQKSLCAFVISEAILKMQHAKDLV